MRNEQASQERATQQGGVLGGAIRSAGPAQHTRGC